MKVGFSESEIPSRMRLCVFLLGSKSEPEMKRREEGQSEREEETGDRSQAETFTDRE